MLFTRQFRRLLLWFTVLCAVALGPGAAAGDAAAEWQAIVALDSGPAQISTPGQNARATALVHLDRQEKALRAFVAAYPTDSHSFEAQLRLARLLQIRADIGGSDRLLTEATRLLDTLEKTASPEQRVEIDFARLTQRMRTLGRPTSAQREQLLTDVRTFQQHHPGDRRIAALLAETATLFTSDPKTMRSLLISAQGIAPDSELRARIADDLKRLDLLGKPLSLEGTTVQGQRLQLAKFRGSVVLVVFFAAWSPPSKDALTTAKRAVASMRSDSVVAIGVSLDTQKPPLERLLQQQEISWPILYDGLGWESPLARRYGVNALPTAWLVDKRGRLRSLSALESAEPHIRQLLKER